MEVLGVLTCQGCGYADSSEPYNDKPSNLRQCHWCKRNKKRTNTLKYDTWYDGTSPRHLPMDCYISQDMKDEVQSWLRTRDDKLADLTYDMEQIRKIAS